MTEALTVPVFSYLAMAGAFVTGLSIGVMGIEIRFGLERRAELQRWKEELECLDEQAEAAQMWRR